MELTPAADVSSTKGNRIWWILGVLLVVGSIAKGIGFIALLGGGGQYFAGGPGCTEPSRAPGYSDAIAGGYRYECVTEIPNVDMGFDSTYEVQGVTDPLNKTITILDTPDTETFIQAHETAHALADIYQDLTAQAYYLAHTGLDHWESTSADDYFDSGSESFAETYAICSLGVRAIHVPLTSFTVLLGSHWDVAEYRLGSCDVVNTTLQMMKHPS